MFDEPVTKQDLQLFELRLKQDLTIRLGCVLAAGFGLMTVLLKVMF
jgi:hypothetical protein